MSEVHTFDQVRDHEQEVGGKKPRRVCFIHDSSDAGEVFSKDESGEFRDVVGQGAAEIHHVALTLTQAHGKTNSPTLPSKESVAAALREFGDATQAVRRLHEEMFPKRDSGSIGREQPLEWSVTKDTLMDAVAKQRARALVCDLDGTFDYQYWREQLAYRFPNLAPANPEIHLEVVAELSVSERQIAAAKRAAGYFAG